MLIILFLVLGIGLIQDFVHLLVDVLDAFNKPGYFISLGLYMFGFCLCSRMKHGNINQTQWLKTQTHLKRNATNGAMESSIITVSHIRKVVIQGLWMFGVVHA